MRVLGAKHRLPPPGHMISVPSSFSTSPAR
jgi:hypothetical protein